MDDPRAVDLCNCGYIKGEHYKDASGCLYEAGIDHRESEGRCGERDEHDSHWWGPNQVFWCDGGNPLQDLEKAKWYIEREIKKRTSEG